MHIGLIGGIGPAATDFYYRGLIARAARASVDLDLTIAHADTPTLLTNLAADDHDAQSAIYLKLTERLANAGAECVAITSIAGHFCVDIFEGLSPLPVVDMMSVLRASLEASGMKRVGLLGTRTVMATSMYGKLGALEVLAPEGEALDRVHEAYVQLATTGQPTDALIDVFFSAGAHLVDKLNVETVLLGGTDLNIAFQGQSCGFPFTDCADIHVDAIAQQM